MIDTYTRAQTSLTVIFPTAFYYYSFIWCSLQLNCTACCFFFTPSFINVEKSYAVFDYHHSENAFETAKAHARDYDLYLAMKSYFNAIHLFFSIDALYDRCILFISACVCLQECFCWMHL